MYQKIEDFFFNIQNHNPGFPWHVSLASFLVQVFYSVYSWLNSMLSVSFTVLQIWVFAVLSVMAVGYINEAIQKAKDHNFRNDMWEDTFGNILGIIFGSIYILYVILVA